MPRQMTCHDKLTCYYDLLHPDSWRWLPDSAEGMSRDGSAGYVHVRLGVPEDGGNAVGHVRRTFHVRQLLRP